MKNFLLGVGAQKAGTTWLFDYLQEFDNTNFGPIKEWHIWDFIYNKSFLNFEVKKENFKDNTINQIRFKMQNQEGFYENYFNSLLSNNSNLTGDITPSYCCLKTEELSHIKEKLMKVGFKVKVVYLMRDPVERCWSATRMIIKLNKKYKNISNHEANILFLNYYNSKEFILRTNYEFTVNNLLNVFNKDQIFFGFYENLFEQNTISNLLQFLEIKKSMDLSNRLSNASPIFTLDSELSNLCREFYAKTYNFCYRTFPITKKIWKIDE